ncbi:MAG TPA: glycerol kinase, partial [Bacteroidetes bacterium]|nr:glycerol kinase [Bacteroidota bacterium]
MNVILAIDLGTTGNRVIAFSENGTVVSKSYYEFPQIFPQPGWVEHDPFDIWNTVKRALTDVAAAVGPENIAAIGITNQRETTILWDKSTGKPVYNAIVWQCRRTASQCDRLREHAGFIKQRTGLFLDPYFSATKIKWILDHVEGARQKAENGQIIFGTVDTWVLWNLTGGAAHATEPSNASRTLCFNIHTLRFDDDLLRIFDIPETLLPEVKESGADFGHTAKKLLGREIPITGILGDQQAAFFAHGGWQEGVIKNTYGTGLFVVTSTGDQIPNSGKLVNTIAWSIDGKVTYALEGSVFIGGAAIQWLRDGLKIIQSAGESEPLAVSLPDNEGVYFVPALAGLGAPDWDPSARGTFLGITRGTGPAHFARAALEAIAYQSKDVIEEMRVVTRG